MRRPFGPICHLVKGTRMIDFNPVWIYHLGQCLGELELALGDGDVQMAEIYREVFMARGAVEGILLNPQHNLFPDTREDLTRLRDSIDLIAPSEARLQHQMHIVTKDEAFRIKQDIIQVRETFERECARQFIVGLEKQRILEPKTLIEEIDNALAPECWKRLSLITKREIEECGKCLAFERYTASGFHVLRGLENEVLDYIWLLAVPRISQSQRNLGQYIAILRANGADPNLIATLENIRSLDRNPLIHPEHWLNKDEAINIFNTAQTALDRLIRDLEKRKMLPPPSV